MTQWIEVAGKDYERYDTKIYNVSLEDKQGIEHKVTLYGMEKITSNPEAASIEEAYKLFPHIPIGSLERPSGEVGLLIGQNYAGILPTGGSGINCVDNLRVMDVQFGSG